MSPNVGAFLERIARAEFFQDVGAPLSNADVLQVSSWDEALQSSNSEAWKGMRVHRLNELSAASDGGDAREPNRLNLFIDTVGGEIEEQVREKAASLPLRPEDKLLVALDTSWELLKACAEIEFAENTRWHRDLVEWYFRGHLPCGWEEWSATGEPHGRLIVF